MEWWSEVFWQIQALDDDEPDEDELPPLAAVSPSPSCPECGAALDEHNSRGECPPY